MKRTTLLLLASVGLALANASHATVWTDADVTQAIKQRLGSLPVGLKVYCKDGIVTLDGAVTNLGDKQRAERIAESRRGVRSVLNKVTVDAGPIPDSSITNAAVEALSDDPAFANQDIKVETARGVVSLKGEVDLYDLKDLTERVVSPIIGVRGIDNQLTVRPDKEPRSDEEIRAHILRRFRSDIWLNDFSIDAEVKGGNVSLIGSAGTLEQLRRATQKAWVKGVIAVDILGLKVDPMVKETSRRAALNPKLSDLELVDAVKDALTYHSWIVSSDIDVTVKESVATLRGKVSSLRVKTAVRRTAQNTVGISRVNDFVTVGIGDTNVEDSVVMDRVTRNLKRNFHTSRYPLKAEVSEGKVTLRGTVETPFERNQAEMAVSSTYGVRSVENEIRTDRKLRGYDPAALEDLTDAHLEPPRRQLPEKSDAEIKKDVESEIFWSWWVDSDAVTVSVKDGEVTLSGKVDSERELRAAVANAFDGGAVTVRNQLSLKN